MWVQKLLLSDLHFSGTNPCALHSVSMMRLSCERKNCCNVTQWDAVYSINSGDYTLYSLAHACTTILAIAGWRADGGPLEILIYHQTLSTS